MKAWLIELVVALVLCCALVLGGFTLGSNHTQAAWDAAKSRQDAQTVKDLTQLIDANRKLTDAATAASNAMQTATASRIEADNRTTKDFKNALRTTAASRAGCVFDADVLHQLDAARARAASAAASGLRHALPGTAASPEQ